MLSSHKLLRHFRIFSIVYLLIGCLSGNVYAHGGASGVDLDQCRIPVSGHWVHFTAYQPAISGTSEFCSAIPELGPTNLVFDYEGKALRTMTVEFEITKEPEGTRIFHQEPKAQPTGSMNTMVTFNEPGNYLAHVTLVNEGQKVDAHVPFTVGKGKGGLSLGNLVMIVLVILALLYIVYLSNAKMKGMVDGMLGKKAE